MAEADRAYREVLAMDPRHFGASHALAVVQAQSGRMEEALSLVEQALRINPQSLEAKATYANVLQGSGRPADALAILNEIVLAAPDMLPALYNRGNVLLALGRHADALADYDRVLVAMPDNAAALYNRGCALQKMQQYQAALASYDKVLAIMPGNFFALHNRGAALLGLKRFGEALTSFDRALTVEVDDVEALTNRGVALYELRRWEEALVSLERALAYRADYAEAWANRANVLFDLKRVDEAFGSWQQALAIRADFVEALISRANALNELGRAAEAIADYEKVLALDPAQNYVSGMLVHAKMHCCEWRGFEQAVGDLIAGVRANRRVVTPFELLNVCDSAADQLQCTTLWTADKFPAATAAGWQGPKYRHDRIRLAYVSADLRDHAAAYLLAGLIEHHDRSRFETIAISFGADPASAMQARLKGAFEHFIDVSDKSDADIVDLMRALEIDIAVDLMGFTTRSRTGIFAQRAAPVQVNYLGYPATMGAKYMDYIFADPTIIPEADRAEYTEKIAYLPTYQPNDPTRTVAEKKFNREEFGLPSAGFVFCCFNNHYKITPCVFASWMRILKQTGDSVLWLSEGNPAVRANLGQEAARHGISADRLIFARRLPSLEEHLARYRLADLFIDTSPYNAHTTASDALWAGLPVLTLMGSTFAGRVAASVLGAAGIPELVADTIAQYEELATGFAQNPLALAELTSKLARNRAKSPLFDIDRYRRHIEAAYTTMWERQQRGEAPATFSVTAMS